MQKKSWMILTLCVALAGFLVVAYFASQSAPEPLTQEQAAQALDQMANAVARKDVSGIMDRIAPNTEEKMAGMHPDQLRVMLARAFHNDGQWKAEYSNLAFRGGAEEAVADFDLTVKESGQQWSGLDYTGHITLTLRRVNVPRFWGLFQGKEWRIVKADSTGPDLSNFGD